MKENAKHYRDDRPLFRIPSGMAEWIQTAAFFFLTVGIILGPLYMVRQVQEETEIIIARLEQSSQQATNRSIRVNVFTLACLQQVEDAQETDQEEALRFELQLARCIREGLIEADELGVHRQPDVLSEATSVFEEPFGSVSLGYILAEPGSSR